MKRPLPKLLQLFLSFLKIGAFTFGGGYAMIALLENEFVSRKKWLDKTEFLDILAVSESTPGPIAVNTATYIGYKVAGVLGSVFATLAVCLPSFIIIFVISLFFDKFLELTWVQYAFRGIQVAVVYLIASAGVKVFKGLEKTPFSVTIAVIVFALFIAFSVLAVRFSTIFYILICGMLGVALYAFREHKAKEKAPVEESAREKSTTDGEESDVRNEAPTTEDEVSETTDAEDGQGGADV